MSDLRGGRIHNFKRLRRTRLNPPQAVIVPPRNIWNQKTQSEHGSPINAKSEKPKPQLPPCCSPPTASGLHKMANYPARNEPSSTNFSLETASSAEKIDTNAASTASV